MTRSNTNWLWAVLDDTLTGGSPDLRYTRDIATWAHSPTGRRAAMHFRKGQAREQNEIIAHILAEG